MVRANLGVVAGSDTSAVISAGYVEEEFVVITAVSEQIKIGSRQSYTPSVPLSTLVGVRSAVEPCDESVTVVLPRRFLIIVTHDRLVFLKKHKLVDDFEAQ